MAKRKVPKGWYSADVHWLAPKRKTPIAYSTVACSATIEAMSEKGTTIQELLEKFDPRTEEARVLEQYVKLGHGGKDSFSLFVNPEMR